MAARKKTAGAVIVAFALAAIDQGDDLVAKAGQRLSLTEAQFKELDGDGLVARGKCVHMRTAISGGRYDLRAGQRDVWLPETVADAWEAAGHCVMADDSDAVALLEAQTGDLADVRADLARAVAAAAEAQDKLQTLALEFAAATDQVAKLSDALSPILESDADAWADAKGELQALIDMLPDQDSAQLALV